MENTSKKTVWDELSRFQIDHFQDLDALILYFNTLRDNHPRCLSYRVRGHGTYETFEGLRNMTESEIAAAQNKKEEHPEYQTYLRLKKIFDEDSTV